MLSFWNKTGIRLGGTAILVVLTWLGTGQSQVLASSAGDWTSYLGNPQSGDYAANETGITNTNAWSLWQQSGWPVQDANASMISTQPVVGSGLVYWGSWDGYMHATPVAGSNGTGGWSTFIGQTDGGSSCNPQVVGAASTPALASETFSAQQGPVNVLYMGGGGNVGASTGKAELYALNAATGQVIWHTPVGPAPANFMWSSPQVYTYTNSAGQIVKSVYIGVASLGDCPEVQGEVVKLDGLTGQVQAVFKTVPDGCTGGPVWGSPTIDPPDNALYIATGNDTMPCNPSATQSQSTPCTTGTNASSEPCAVSVIKLRLSDLSYVSSWQVPPSSQIVDSDFGNTPTLFHVRDANNVYHAYVGVANKNGIYYAFDRAHLASGPVWQTQISTDQDNGSVSPSAYDQSNLYVAGDSTTINGQSCWGSVRELNPLNGAVIWQDCLGSGVLGAVLVTPTVVVVDVGTTVQVLDKTNGKALFIAGSADAQTATPGKFWGAPTISNGVLYAGDTHGRLYAWAPTCPSSLVASFSSSNPAPLTWSAGQTQTYNITVTNTGTQTWNATGSQIVRLGVEFGTASDWAHDGWATDQRFFLPNDVPPGASVTVPVSVTAPTTTGTYVLHYHMVKENVSWFNYPQDTSAVTVQ